MAVDPFTIASLAIGILAAAPRVVGLIGNIQDAMASTEETKKMANHLDSLYNALAEMESDARRLGDMVPDHLSEVINILGDYCRDLGADIYRWYRKFEGHRSYRVMNWFATTGGKSPIAKYRRRLEDCENWYNIALKTFHLAVNHELRARSPGSLPEHVTEADRLRASSARRCRNELRQHLGRIERAKDLEKSRYRKMERYGIELRVLEEFARDALYDPSIPDNVSVASFPRPRSRNPSRPRNRGQHRHTERPVRSPAPAARVPESSRHRQGGSENNRLRDYSQASSSRAPQRFPAEPPSAPYVNIPPYILETRAAYQQQEPHYRPNQQPAFDNYAPEPSIPFPPAPPSYYSQDGAARNGSRRPSQAPSMRQPPRRARPEANEPLYPPATLGNQRRHDSRDGSRRSRSPSLTTDLGSERSRGRRPHDRSSSRNPRPAVPGSRYQTRENIPPPPTNAPHTEENRQRTRTASTSGQSTRYSETTHATTTGSSFVPESPRSRIAELQGSTRRPRSGAVPETGNTRRADVRDSRPPMRPNPHNIPAPKRTSSRGSSHRSSDSGFRSRSDGSSFAGASAHTRYSDEGYRSQTESRRSSGESSRSRETRHSSHQSHRSSRSRHGEGSEKSAGERRHRGSSTNRLLHYIAGNMR